MTQATPTTAPVLHGRYRIEEKLGTGRLAVVYRAFDERLQRPVLVHMLRKELIGQEPLRQRFVQEAHASARRSHQSLLELFDSGEVSGRPYMVTEYVAGRTIRQLGALSLEEALLYFRQLVGAIAVCQSSNVPHPPISSRNLILVADGHVELVESWLTPPNEIALDLASYRPPERTEGLPATPASVVYSLGLLLLEMVSGRRVFEGTDARAVAQAHISGRIPTLSEARPSLRIPPLEQIISKATARRPEDRYSDAATLGRALDDLWRTLNSETQRLSNPPVQRTKLRERINRAANDVVAPRPVPVAPQRPAPAATQPAVLAEEQAPPLPEPDDMPLRRQSRRRSVVGLVVMLMLFLVAGVLAYSLATAAVERLVGFRLPLPRVQINLPSVPSNLPEWLTGVVSGGQNVYVVSGVADEGLNLRDAAGVNSNVIGLLPNGTLVRKLEGPRNVDGVDWLRVRTRSGDKELEGWVSLKFIKPVGRGDR